MTLTTPPQPPQDDVPKLPLPSPDEQPSEEFTAPEEGVLGSLQLTFKGEGAVEVSHNEDGSLVIKGLGGGGGSVTPKPPRGNAWNSEGLRRVHHPYQPKSPLPPKPLSGELVEALSGESEEERRAAMKKLVQDFEDGVLAARKKRKKGEYQVGTKARRDYKTVEYERKPLNKRDLVWSLPFIAANKVVDQECVQLITPREESHEPCFAFSAQQPTPYLSAASTYKNLRSYEAKNLVGCSKLFRGKTLYYITQRGIDLLGSALPKGLEPKPATFMHELYSSRLNALHMREGITVTDAPVLRTLTDRQIASASRRWLFDTKQLTGKDFKAIPQSAYEEGSADFGDLQLAEELAWLYKVKDPFDADLAKAGTTHVPDIALLHPPMKRKDGTVLHRFSCVEVELSSKKKSELAHILNLYARDERVHQVFYFVESTVIAQRVVDFAASVGMPKGKLLVLLWDFEAKLEPGLLRDRLLAPEDRRKLGARGARLPELHGTKTDLGVKEFPGKTSFAAQLQEGLKQQQGG